MASAKGGQTDNANAGKTADKLFRPYDWATEQKPAASTFEEMGELRNQRLKLRNCLRNLKEHDARKESCTLLFLEHMARDLIGCLQAT